MTTMFFRKISQHVDFDFIYEEVKETYGEKGNVRSEGELMLTLAECLGWLWFWGMILRMRYPITVY
ncbi:MAG: hypothetical protein JSV25_09415 [Spirochaetota bacterium]|nr:MAG: hypothetical protein JSV25_09415 [Spirochaetota bacterium]